MHFDYSVNGDLEKMTTPDGVTNYTYDALGNLIKVVTSGKTIEYVIDGRNRRVAKTVDGTVQYRLLYKDQLNPVAKVDADGNIDTLFMYGERSNVPSYLMKDGATYRVVFDHLGSVRLIVNSSTGEIVQQIEYSEFGKVLSDTNPGFQPFGFAGGLYDVETGLVRFGARDYLAEIGRWVSKDPIRFGGGTGNLYEYCGNDPVNFVDVSGFYPEENIFDTIEEAAIDALDTYLDTSIEMNREVGGFIMATGDGHYYATEGKLGEHDNVDIGDAPETAVGWYHTHGSKDENGDYCNFSTGDMIYTLYQRETLTNRGFNGDRFEKAFVGTPERGIKSQVFKITANKLSKPKVLRGPVSLPR